MKETHAVALESGAYSFSILAWGEYDPKHDDYAVWATVLTNAEEYAHQFVGMLRFGDYRDPDLNDENWMKKRLGECWQIPVTTDALIIHEVDEWTDMGIRLRNGKLDAVPNNEPPNGTDLELMLIRKLRPIEEALGLRRNGIDTKP